MGSMCNVLIVQGEQSRGLQLHGPSIDNAACAWWQGRPTSLPGDGAERGPRQHDDDGCLPLPATTTRASGSHPARAGEVLLSEKTDWIGAAP